MTSRLPRKVEVNIQQVNKSELEAPGTESDPGACLLLFEERWESISRSASEPVASVGWLGPGNLPREQDGRDAQAWPLPG